jgi:hypothetical protein
MDSYHKLYCPKCENINFFCSSYEEGDFSGIDVDGIECWGCGFVWSLVPGETVQDSDWIERGLERLDH